MEDFIRSIFENAILREQLMYKRYIELSKKTSNLALKKTFEKLAEEELIHEILFKKKDLRVLKIVNSTQLTKLHILNDIDKTGLETEEIDDINKAFDLAIDEEQKAFEDYSLMINHLEFGDIRETFKEIAQQELRHKQLLQKVKLEFNDNDWNYLR